MTGYEHLHPSTVPLLALSAADRIERVRTKRWIPYASIREPYAAMRILLDIPRQQRPENILIEAPTNNGKSTLLERFEADHPPLHRPDEDRSLIPVLMICLPEHPTLIIVYQTILDRLGCPYAPSARRAELRRAVVTILEKVGTRVLLVDEVHNLALSGPQERDAILAFFRALGNEQALRISLVFAGTPGARITTQSDPQLLNRFDVFQLRAWRDGDTYRELLASFEALMPLRQSSCLGDDDAIARDILRRGEGVIGEFFKIVSRAAVLAIETGEERITLKTLSRIRYQSPSHRKIMIDDMPVLS